jgi:Flp pilus assembly protein TadG
MPVRPSTIAQLPARLARRACTALARACDDRSGNIGMLFAFMIIPVIGVIGFSVDYGRALEDRSAMQTALDSAVLAAGREYQVTGDPESAEAVAADYFHAAMEGIEGVEIVTNQADTATSTMRFTGAVKVKTTFARLLGFDEIEVSSTSEAMLAQGGIDKNLEISLMLDVTGSMCQPCSKLEDLKTASKDLINILVQDDQSTYTSRVALVPFSHAVNAGAYFEQVTGVPQSSDGHFSYPDKCYKDGVLKKSCEGDDKYWVDGADYSTCVVERAGSDKFTDALPGSDDDNWLGIFDVERENSDKVNGSTACKPAAEIVPLTSDKAAITGAIDDFQAGGWTAGQIGTAWAWYMLSPKWNEIWPAGSQAAAYSDSETTKIAVLMTDGEYNTAYQTGNGSSGAQAKQLCKNMKDEGITVYTVGFMVSDSAKKLLEDCASTESHFYDATDGEKLKIAFRSIAFKVAQLRLSK